MRIALTFTDTEEKHRHYVHWLKGNDSIEVVKLAAADNNLQELDNCDALVLAGGRDIHPKLYLHSTKYHNAPVDFDEARDTFEIAAFHKAQSKGKPVLGICRGMQLVNCILGGTLQQDLGALNIIHKMEGPNDKAHGVHVVPNTLLHSISLSERGVVNSAHHQAIDRLGEGLKVNCRADDNTIEGVEWEQPAGKPFLLCVQWHPERMFTFQLEAAALSHQIRQLFMEAILQKQ